MGEWLYIDSWFLDLGTVVSFTTMPLYPRGKTPGTHWIEGWVNRRTGLNDMEK
jgi:hypothetical protein